MDTQPSDSLSHNIRQRTQELGSLPHTAGIYSIENTANGKVYIGSAAKLRGRWINHRHLLRRGDHTNSYLQRAWNKYGDAAFVFKILLHCDPAFLLVWEQIAIEGHISTLGWENMYNLSPTASSNLGCKQTDTFRNAMRGNQYAKGHKHTPEARARMSASQKARLTPEIIEKTASANRGKKRSDETRRKQSESAKGKNTWTKGVKHTPEHCAAISAALVGRVKSDEERAAISRGLTGKKQSAELVERRIAPLRGREQTQEAYDARMAALHTPEAVAKKKASHAAFWASPEGLALKEKKSLAQRGNPGKLFKKKKKPWEVG